VSGVSRLQYSTAVRLIRVNCTGRVDMAFIFRAFSKGMDGVCIVGCWPGECNYATGGNYHAFNMVQLSKRLLEHEGVNPERLMIDWCSSSEGIRFANLIDEFSKRIRELGPLGKAEGVDPEELKSRLEAIAKLIPYIKLAKRDKLSLRFDDLQKYEELYTLEEVDQLLKEVPSYWIDPEKCQACGTCRRRCPVDAISGDKNLIHVIDQNKCIKCGTCYEVCPPRFRAVQKLVGEPVPPPIPEEKRVIVRKKEGHRTAGYGH